MAFVIGEACVDVKDKSCIEVCPVNCIYGDPQDRMCFIHPEECIDCGACVPACPVTAIYDSIDSTPSSQKDLIEANAVYRNGDGDAMAKAEAIVKRHVESHADLMAVAPTERQAAHT